MSGLPVILYDGKGTKKRARVTERGQVVVAPISYNKTYFQSLNAVNVGFNFIEPISHCQFVIDGVILSGDKSVNATDGAVVDIYEADAVGSNVIQKSIFRLDIGKLDRVPLSNLNLLTSPGVWINAKTDDATVNVTLIGYFVKQV